MDEDNPAVVTMICGIVNGTPVSVSYPKIYAQIYICARNRIGKRARVRVLIELIGTSRKAYHINIFFNLLTTVTKILFEIIVSKESIIKVIRFLILID